jgi:hypothetical protein
MSTYFFRLCLLLAFLLCAGCLGGPKVVPPEITGEGVAGIGGPSNTTRAGEMADGDMDAGTEPPPTTVTSGGTGGQGGDQDAYQESDAGVTDDDAGSLREP